MAVRFVAGRNRPRTQPTQVAVMNDAKVVFHILIFMRLLDYDA